MAPSTTNNPKSYVSTSPQTFFNAGTLVTPYVFYAGFTERMSGIIVSMPDGLYVNKVAAITVAVNYWNGTAWTPVIGLEDSTANADGISLSQSGMITWNQITENTEFKRTLANDYEFYYYEIVFSAALSEDVRIDYIGGMSTQKTIAPYRFPVFWQNRLWMFNDQADKKNVGICSAYGTNCVFNGDDSVEREFGDAKELVCGESMFTRYGSNIYDNLVLCKRGATYLVDGYGPATWVIYTISDKVGCLAPLTMKRCDMSYEIAAGMTKHVLMWRSARGVEFFDGNTIAQVDGDIRNFFDPASDDYIDPVVQDVSLESAFYDEINFEYHWLFTNANGKQEWVYSLKYRKWYQIDRGTKALTCGFNVQDLAGNSFVFAGTSDGFIERLEYGTTFDLIPITYTLWTGDILLAKTGDYVCKLRHIKLFGKSKVSANTVAATIYLDTALTGISLPAISQIDPLRRIYQVKHSCNYDAVMHGLKYEITTTTESIGFEPFLISGLYSVVREDF